VEDEKPRMANVTYDYLTLRFTNMMVDLRTSLHVSCVQFERSKYLDEALKKVNVEPKIIFKHCRGHRWMLEYIQYQEKSAF
jgi:CDP-diacylglycerol pyrophosphatase